jgi:ribonuclease P protein component
MARFSFPRQARLRSEGEFRRVYAAGSARLHVGPLRVRALRQADGRSRLGLSIGRKTGDAVVRNRWKRAIREAFRLNRHLLRVPHDMVISVDWEAAPDRVCEVEAAFLEVVERLNAAQEAPNGRP